MMDWKSYNLNRVHVHGLREALNPKWVHKIPANVDRTFQDVEVCNVSRNPMGRFEVMVTPSSTIGSSKGRGAAPRKWKGTGHHRMHLKCPHCSKWIAAGKYGQHHRAVHAGKVTTFTDNGNNEFAIKVNDCGAGHEPGGLLEQALEEVHGIPMTDND